MKITLNKIGAYQQSSVSNAKTAQRFVSQPQNQSDSFVSFTSKESKKDNSLKRNLKLLTMIAMFSAASQAQGQSRVVYENSPNTISVENKKWWNKFSPEEKRVIEKVQNEVARVYGETGEKVSSDEAQELLENLGIDEEQTQLVKDLLNEYEDSHYNDFYALDSEHMSPRAQKLKQNALIEVFTYSSKTGRVVRYSDKNIQIIAKRIGAKEEEKPLIKYFLKSYLNINQNQPADSSYERDLLGDLR